MINPGLPPDQFQPDRLMNKERLVGVRDLALLPGAEADGGGFVFRAESRLDLTLDRICPDLDQFNQLSLRLLNRSARPLLAGLTLIHAPPPGRAGPRPTSFSGNRELLPPDQWVDLKFPRDCFGVYGRPDGWSRIQEVVIHVVLEKTETDPSPFDLSFHSLNGELLETPSGPRLTAAGMRAVSDRVPDVGSFFQEHDLFNSTGPGSGFEILPPHSYPVEPADGILAGSIMGRRMSMPLDWRASPDGRMEWTHFLNRHHFLRELIKSRRGDSGRAAVETLDRILGHWIMENPSPLDSNGGAGPAWETLSTAWRLREWLWVIGLAWSSPYFSEAGKDMMLRSLWEHAVSLLDHQGHPTNWIIVESAALALAGMCMPFFHQAKTWVDSGLDRLEREGRRQFFLDGAHYELSPLYQAICVSALLEVKQAAAGLSRPLPELFGRPLERSIEFLAALSRPDFTWPSFNDSGSAARDYTGEIRRAGRLFGRPDFLWIGSRGEEGVPPEERFQAFPEAGLAVMRSGWSPRSRALFFRAGPAGAAHVHEDVLSLDVTVFGRPRLVDPGITAYAPGPLTDYYRSAEAHNTLLINGEGALRSRAGFSERTRPAGPDFTWRTSGRLDVAAGFYPGPWGRGRIRVDVRRGVVWVDRSYWIVRDFIRGLEVTSVQVCWQFAPGETTLEQNGTIKTAPDNSGALRLIPLPGAHRLQVDAVEGRAEPPGGWVSAAGIDIPATRVRYSVQAAGPVSLVWLLVPETADRAGEVRAVRKDEQDGPIVLEIGRPSNRVDVVRLGPIWPEARIHTSGPSK
ncbi:MAG: heparinase II/III family protein [Proteobacteria bacterium]|nr:heparinase II/III family protein [Pseudomonadota bacterium]